MAFAGAVLTGGAGSRMGRDKALVEVAGRPLVAMAAAALVEAGAGSVLAVGGDGPALTSLGLEWVADEAPGEGPLGGLLTALRSLPAVPLVVVLACDLPSASAANVRAVVEAARPAADRPAVAVPTWDGEREWLHACWTSHAVGILEAAWTAGERAPRRAVEGLQVVDVEAPDTAGLADADRLEDLPHAAEADPAGEQTNHDR